MDSDIAAGTGADLAAGQPGILGLWRKAGSLNAQTGSKWAGRIGGRRRGRRCLLPPRQKHPLSLAKLERDGDLGGGGTYPLEAALVQTQSPIRSYRSVVPTR